MFLGPDRQKHFTVFLRAGYRTLFERGDDADAVYKEYRKFDGLLTKLAFSKLNRGTPHDEQMKAELATLLKSSPT